MNKTVIYNAVRGGIRGGRMPESALDEPVESILSRWELLKDGKPVNAAVALFAGTSNPFPQLSLRMARFRGTDMKEFIDSKWKRGNIFELLDMGMAFCFKHLNLNGRIRGLVREEHLEIPVEALREALTNALCHRRYDNPSESIGLAIFDDRVEISNPGHFPPGVTPENIKAFHTSQPHNPKLAQVLYKATRIENWGSGIQRMVSACLNQELPEPDYQIWADGTIIIVFRKKAAMGSQTDVPQGVPQGDIDSSIVRLIREDKGISAERIAEKLSVSAKTIKRHIANMPTIRYVGSGYSGHWEIIDEDAPKEDSDN